MSQREWHVLLIGGPSGVGKTSLCASLIRRYEIRSVEVDDIHAAVSAMTTPEQQPVLHQWAAHPETASWLPERIRDLHLAAAAALAPAVSAVIEAHLNEGPAAVVEGDYLLPSMVPADGCSVRAVFLYEPDENQLVTNMVERAEKRSDEHDARAHVSWLIGQRLVSDANERRIPALPARPWETLEARVLAAIGRPDR